MFDQRAFRTWGRVLFGACVFSVLFLGIMMLAEAVVGTAVRLSRAALALGAAAFVGYVGTAWIVRRDGASRTDP